MSSEETLQYLEVINKLIVVLGFPLAVYQYFKTKKKERQDREYGTYNSLDEKYLEYQKLCLYFPHIDAFDIQDDKPNVLSEKEKKEELILFTMLISIFERAYLLYSDQKSDIKKRQWSGWETYIQSYCKRENFLSAWQISGHTFDTDFECYIRNVIKNSRLEININQ